MKVVTGALTCAACVVVVVVDGLFGTPVLGQAPYARRKR